MSKKIKMVVLAILAALAIVIGVGLLKNGAAVAVGDNYNEICNDSGIDHELRARAGCSEDKKINSVAVKLFNWFMWIITAVGVITVIFAGQRYITSDGDTSKVQQARRMIFYAVIGIVVAAISFILVNFVMKNLTK